MVFTHFGRGGGGGGGGVEILQFLTQRPDPNQKKQADQGRALFDMGLVVRKPVFGVSNKAFFKPVSTATETC